MNENITKATGKIRNTLAELREIDFGLWGNEAIREEVNEILRQVSLIENENK